MKKKIVFTTGGTGGHIFPAINLMKHFLGKGYEVLIVTDKRGNNFIKDYPEFKSYVLNTGTTTNKNILRKIFSLFLIFFSFIKSLIILKKEKPHLIFGFGGYVSFPISFASKFLNLPLIIYENNMILGRANKYLSSVSRKILLAKKILINYPKKIEKKTFEVGAILDKKIINHSSAEKNQSKNFSILVLGGSQGAEIFGQVIPEVIKMINEQGYKIEIMQQCIAQQKKVLENFYNENKIKNYIFEFEKNILNLIESCNLAITRCGASTTAELECTLTPFIAVPLPDSIENHQFYNGKYYENNGCCWLLEQKNFNTKNLFNLIINAIKNKNKLEDMGKNMKKNQNKNVYDDIENQIKEFI